MKGPGEQAMANTDDFSEYMWMAEENLEEFDKQVTEELEEKERMEAALDAFVEEYEADLYTQNQLPVQQPRNNQSSRQNRSFHQARSMTTHMNGFGDPAASGYGNSQPLMTLTAPQQGDSAASALNPNAPEFVPRWVNAGGVGFAAAATAVTTPAEDKNDLSTNGTSEKENGSATPPPAQ